MVRRGGPLHSAPSHAAPSLAQTPAKPFPQSAIDALAVVLKHVRLSGHNRSRTTAQINEWQSLLDSDVFCVAPDRRSLRLTLLQQLKLLEILAKFFEERKDDPNKYAYFEAIFLGREGEPSLHELRIDVLFKLASYSLQYPVLHLFLLISQWLNKVVSQKPYAENLVELLTEHFIKPSADRKMYEFLLPLEQDSKDFTVYFLAYAHRYCEMSAPLAIITSNFMYSNTFYVINTFRDCPALGKEFAQEMFPKCLVYCIDDHEEKEYDNAAYYLHGSIGHLLRGWKEKIKDIQLNYDPLFDPELPWNKRRFHLLQLIGKHESHDTVKQMSTRLNDCVPAQYADEFSNILCPFL